MDDDQYSLMVSLRDLLLYWSNEWSSRENKKPKLNIKDDKSRYDSLKIAYGKSKTWNKWVLGQALYDALHVCNINQYNTTLEFTYSPAFPPDSAIDFDRVQLSFLTTMKIKMIVAESDRACMNKVLLIVCMRSDEISTMLSALKLTLIQTMNPSRLRLET